jgi:hypothetical protein
VFNSLQDRLPPRNVSAPASAAPRAVADPGKRPADDTLERAATAFDFLRNDFKDGCATHRTHLDKNCAERCHTNLGATFASPARHVAHKSYKKFLTTGPQISRCYFFECVFLLEKLVLVGLIIFLDAGSSFQVLP